MGRPITRYYLLSAMFAAFAPLLCSAARDDLWLDVNIASKHSANSYMWQGRRSSFNESNLGLGATWQMNRWCDVKGGWFNNSYEKTSVYALVNPKWELLDGGSWSLAPGVAAGLV